MTRKHNPRPRRHTHKAPEGSVGILKARTSKGPWYTVDNNTGYLHKRNLCPGKWWFPYATDIVPKIGFCFDNYFHALAYSLKRKAANGPDPS